MTGNALLLLHGMWGGSRHWAPLAARLKGRRVLAPDLPGFGTTPNPEKDYRPAFLVEWLVSFLDEQGVARPVVVGNSLGGRLAVGLAEAGRAEAVVLVSPAGLTAPATWLKALPRFRLPGVGVDPRAYVEMALAQVFARPLADPRTLPLAEAEREALARVSFAEFLQGSARCLAEMAKDVPPEARLGPLPVRGLIWGRQDRLIPLEVAATLSRIWPAARLEVLEDSGHVPQLETPEAFALALRRCLEPAHAT